MIIIFSVIVFIVLVFALSILIFAYKILPRKLFLLFAITFYALPYFAYKTHQRDFVLDSIPAVLQVKNIKYIEEESWGFGPGGNEAGIRVFDLSQTIADEITNNGIAFFYKMNVDESQHYIAASFSQWSETPILATPSWMKDSNGQLDVYDYICKHGRCIDIEAEIVKTTHQIINQRANYYAIGRIGLIIVSPSKKMVIYLYRG